MSAQDRHNAPPAPSGREYEALTADAELGRKRGEWLTEAYARISELEVENRRLREALERIAEHGTHGEGWKHWLQIAREALNG